MRDDLALAQHVWGWVQQYGEGRSLARLLPDDSLVPFTKAELVERLPDIYLTPWQTASASVKGAGGFTVPKPRKGSGRKPRKRHTLKEKIHTLRKAGMPLATLKPTAQGGEMKQVLMEVLFPDVRHHLTYERAFAEYVAETGDEG